MMRVSVPEMSLDYVLATYRALSLRLLNPERQMLLNAFSKQKSRLHSSFSPSLVGGRASIGIQAFMISKSFHEH